MKGNKSKRDLWQTRNQAFFALEGNLQHEAEVIDDMFALTDESIKLFSRIDSVYARVCGITLIKARNLILGCYSLALDGLAQEGGALFRLVIESIELLIYFEEDPTRIDQMLDGPMPKAGEIANKIQGNLQGLRNFLNTYASHFSFSPESLQHIFNSQTFTWTVTQPHRDDVLRTNLIFIFLSLILLVCAGANCLKVENTQSADSFAKRIEDYRLKGFNVFNLSHQMQPEK
jgi:hypothetical protein